MRDKLTVRGVVCAQRRSPAHAVRHRDRRRRRPCAHHPAGPGEARASTPRRSRRTATPRPRCPCPTSGAWPDRPDGTLILMTAISPTPAGEGKTTTSVGLADALQPARQEVDGRAARAVDGPGVRHEGRRGRRRLRPGGPDDRHQPALHRRLRRDRGGQQPALRPHRQPHPPGQRARHRPAHDHLEARASTSTTAPCATSSSGSAASPTATPARTASTSWSPPR